MHEGKKRKSDEAMLLDASCFLPLSELMHVSKRSGCNLESDRTSKKKFVQVKITDTLEYDLVGEVKS